MREKGILGESYLSNLEMRQVYVDILIDIAKNKENVLAVEVDVMNSMGTAPFAREFPERSINCGIMEANAIGVSSGLSLRGFIPFVHMFGVFATRRCYDQVFVSGSYAGSNIKIIGGDSGVTASMNGGTHMPFEDMGIMRNIPEMIVLEPADTETIKAVVPQIAERYGMCYMRSTRKKAYNIYDKGYKFEIGKANILCEGDDATIIACGILVRESLIAADKLRAQGIGVRVVDMFTIKPIDRSIIIDSAKRTGAIVTAENHNIINGLGSAVSEVLVEECPVPMERIGVEDRFGQVGTVEELMLEYRLTDDAIINKVLKVIKRKEADNENCGYK